jgi:predicted site-specific integrase-resolvase
MGLKEIPTQMIYRYMDQGMIPFQVTEDGKRIQDEDAVAWIAKYTSKRQAKGA